MFIWWDKPEPAKTNLMMNMIMEDIRKMRKELLLLTLMAIQLIIFWVLFQKNGWKM